jgi:hypothetical protein
MRCDALGVSLVSDARRRAAPKPQRQQKCGGRWQFRRNTKQALDLASKSG